jgi:maleate isomerase
MVGPVEMRDRTTHGNYSFALSVYKNGLDADAIFITCGAMQTIETIEALERMTLLPVVSSNICNIWHCMKLLGIHEPVSGYGSLMEVER